MGIGKGNETKSAIIDALDDNMTGRGGEGSAYCSWKHSGGILTKKELTLNPGAGAGKTANIFTIGNTVRVHELFLHVTEVTNTTTFDNVKFQLFDGANTADLTGSVDASGALVGAGVVRNNRSDQAAQFYNTDVVRVIDPPATGVVSLVYAPCILHPKYEATTYLRLVYDADADTDLVIHVHCRWAPIVEGGDVVSV